MLHSFLWITILNTWPSLKNFWVETTEGSFIPRFAAQLIGAKAGDKRTVNVDFPADFVTKELQGKKGSYEVELVEVKEKVLPGMKEEIAKKFGEANGWDFSERSNSYLVDMHQWWSFPAFFPWWIWCCVAWGRIDGAVCCIMRPSRQWVSCSGPSRKKPSPYSRN